jgi:hypothetical protein
MPQEDYFKREIDKLGKLLAKALADLLNLKSANKLTDGIESVNQIFKTELNVTIDSLLQISENEFLPFLVNAKSLNNNQLELIADILVETADNSEKKLSLNAYQKALLLYKYVTENESDYSVNRHYKAESITAQIKNLNN